MSHEDASDPGLQIWGLCIGPGSRRVLHSGTQEDSDPLTGEVLRWRLSHTSLGSAGSGSTWVSVCAVGSELLLPAAARGACTGRAFALVRRAWLSCPSRCPRDGGLLVSVQQRDTARETWGGATPAQEGARLPPPPPSRPCYAPGSGAPGSTGRSLGTGPPPATFPSEDPGPGAGLTRGPRPGAERARAGPSSQDPRGPPRARSWAKRRAAPCAGPRRPSRLPQDRSKPAR